MTRSEAEIIKNWKGNIAEPLVSIKCTTFNHCEYIKDAIEGFLIQETTFPFEIIIHDDASTDGTEEIVRQYYEKYPAIIRPMFEKENQYSKNAGRMRENINAMMRGKYVAICEGDDYWIDPLKLQRQVLFLESHPNYSLCFHPVLNMKNGRVIGDDRHFRRETDVPTWNIIAYGGMYCATCSLMFRRKDYLESPKFRKMSDIGDYPLQIHLSLLGRTRYLRDIMGVYRQSIKGSWIDRNMFDKFNIMQHFQIEKSWLAELNQYTGGNFKDAIQYHIVDYMHYANHQINNCRIFEYREMMEEWVLIESIRIKIKILKDITKKNIKKIVGKKMPFLRKPYKRLKYGHK